MGPKTIETNSRIYFCSDKNYIFIVHPLKTRENMLFLGFFMYFSYSCNFFFANTRGYSSMSFWSLDLDLATKQMTLADLIFEVDQIIIIEVIYSSFISIQNSINPFYLVTNSTKCIKVITVVIFACGFTSQVDTLRWKDDKVGWHFHRSNCNVCYGISLGKWNFRKLYINSTIFSCKSNSRIAMSVCYQNPTASQNCSYRPLSL